MGPIAIVGEAVVRVRVISDRLGADIRDAVKKGLADANGDIDSAGESAGKRMSDGVAKGVRKNREKLAKDIGTEIELSARRFTADSEGANDDDGDRIGRRFITGMGDGIDDRAAWDRNAAITVRNFQNSMDRAGLDRSGRFIGDRFMQSIAGSLRDNETTLRRQVESSVSKAVAIRSNSDLVRIGRQTGNNFTRAIGSGMSDSDSQGFINNEFRRVFTMRPGDIDAIGSGIGDRTMRQITEGVRRAEPDTRRSFREAAANAQSEFRNRLLLNNQKFRDIGFAFARNVTQGFGSGNAMGEAGRRAGRQLGNTTGDEAANSLSRSMRRNQGRLRVDWGNIGKDLGQHFNLGIGAAKMGAGIISILTTAGPSLIAGAAAIGTAMAAEIVTAMAAIGPGITGALVLGGAALATFALNFGLLKLAFSGTSDQAKAFKKEMTDFKGRLTEAFAPGVLTGFSDLIGKLSRDLLPQINDQLAATGVAMGNIARRIGETVTSGDNLGRIKGILATNTTFLDNFGQGLSGLTTSFLILFNAAKPFVDFMGDAIKRFGDWASASLAVSESNGNLAAWMDRMLASFRDLSAIIGNFGTGFANIFKAAAPAGQTMLDSIRDIGQRFSDWTSDSPGMTRMTAFFEKAHILASKVWEVLGAIFTAGGRAFEGMDLGPILHVLDTLQNVVAPAIARFFNQIQAGASDNLVKAFDNIGVAVTKIADNGGFEKVANLIGTVIEKITEFAASDFGAAILGIILPFAIMGGILTSLVGPLFAVGKGLFTLASAAGLISAPVLAVAAAVAATVAAFVVMWNNSERLRESIGTLGEKVGGAFMAVWDKLAPKIQEIWEKFQVLAGVIGDRLAPVIEFLTPVIERAIGFIGDIFGNIFDAIGGLIDLLTGLLTGDWSKIWEGLTEIVSAAWNQITTIFGGALSAISFIWDAITAVVYNAGQVLYKFFASIWEGITGVLETAWGGISSTAETVWGNITDFFSRVWDQVKENAQAAWDGVTGFLSDVWNGISNTAETIWNGITGFFSGVWDGVSEAASTVWNGITTFLGIIWNGIVEGVGKVWNTVFEISMIPLRSLLALVLLIWDHIKEGLEIFWNAIVSVAKTIWNGLTAFFSTVWDGVLAVVNYVWTQITTALTGAWNIIATVAETIWGGITDFFSTVWDGVLVVAETAWSIITTVLSTAWEAIVTIASVLWGTLVAILEGVWTGITNAAVFAWGYLTGFFSTVWTGIVVVATTIWNGLVAMFNFVWDIITTVATTVWSVLSGFLSGIWNAISTAATTIWTGISTFFGTIWETISNIFHTVVDAVANWLSGRWNDISTTASSIWNGIVGIASTVWNDIIGAIERVVEPIVGWLQEKWDDITTAISTAWSGLEGIVSGIWEGIKRVIVAPIEDAYYSLVGWIEDIKKLITDAWDTVSGIVTNINNAVAGAADKIAEANTASLGANAAFGPPTAEGGVFRPTPGGQLRTIAEAGQAERVEPLDPNGLSRRDLAWVDKLIEAGGGGLGGGVTVKVFIGEQELTSIVNTQVERSNSALARDARSRRV